MPGKRISLLVLLAASFVILALGGGGIVAQEQSPQRTTSPHATLDGGFTYQGQLGRNGSPYSGTCSLRFSLHDAASGGNQVGATQTISNVSVQRGLFTVVLNGGSEFGWQAFTGSARWLNIRVRCGGEGSYTTLNPRQPLTPVPYALSLRPGAIVIGQEVNWDALHAENYATTGASYGLYGQSSADQGRGVNGLASHGSGTNYGVYGESLSTAGTGVYGRAPFVGISGIASSSSTTNIGVYGYTPSTATNAKGVFGYAAANSGETYGVYGQTNSGYGVGVYGYASAESGINAGVRGETATNSGAGVYGYNSHPIGWGQGVKGVAVQGTGVLGRVTGLYQASAAVEGFDNDDNPHDYAGNFHGPVRVAGNLSKGGGSFLIDHPLDPENKYLYHSFVESPDMMNIYNGNVTLDENGQAWVQLPEWFEALNKDFRYQLTPIGAPGPNLYVDQEILDNRFLIAGGDPGMKVSWQVTGTRHDAYAEMYRIPVEEEKPPRERGLYLHPEAWGVPREMGLEYALQLELFGQQDAEP